MAPMFAWAHARRVLGAVLCLGAAPALAQTTRICQIQGSGPTPNMVGSRVSVTGVVTADFNATSVKGLFIQEPGCDGDATTSDGIFVDTSNRSVAATVGNRVTVTGRVTNDSGLTAISLESLSDGGSYAGSIEAIRLTLPVDATAAATYLESFEGMLVGLAPSRVVGATNHYGDVYVMPEASGVTRLYRGDTDGRRLCVFSPASWLSVNQGDRLPDVTGVLTYQYGEFTVLARPTRPPTVEPAGLAAPQGLVAPAGLTIASYNLENLFDAVDDPGTDDTVATPDQYAAALGARGASLARYLGLPDIVAVQEVEKVEVLQDLTIQPELLAGSYRAVLVEGADPRGIDVGLLYRSDRLALRSYEARQGCTSVKPWSTAITSCTLPGGVSGYALFARPPLVVRLESTASGERLTVVVNHFKAQDDGDADDLARLAMADHVRALVEELKVTEPDVPVLVAGDLNDFEDSATLVQLKAGGLLDLHGRSGERPYTYVYRGRAQVLDYVLVDPVLAGRVLDFRSAHVNVDFGAPAPGTPSTGLHVSDHDPVVLTLRSK